MGDSVHPEHSSRKHENPLIHVATMKAFIVLALAAAAYAAPALEDTAEVAAAKAEFKALFDAAEAGDHAKLAPAQVEAAYLPLSEDVAAAKADFMAAFDAPVVYNAAPYYYNYAHVPAFYNHHYAYPAAYHTAYTTYSHAYPAVYNYAHYPYVAVAAPAEEKAEEH